MDCEVMSLISLIITKCAKNFLFFMGILNVIVLGSSASIFSVTLVTLVFYIFGTPSYDYYPYMTMIFSFSY